MSYNILSNGKRLVEIATKGTEDQKAILKAALQLFMAIDELELYLRYFLNDSEKDTELTYMSDRSRFFLHALGALSNIDTTLRKLEPNLIVTEEQKEALVSYKKALYKKIDGSFFTTIAELLRYIRNNSVSHYDEYGEVTEYFLTQLNADDEDKIDKLHETNHPKGNIGNCPIAIQMQFATLLRGKEGHFISDEKQQKMMFSIYAKTLIDVFYKLKKLAVITTPFLGDVFYGD